MDDVALDTLALAVRWGAQGGSWCRCSGGQPSRRAEALAHAHLTLPGPTTPLLSRVGIRLAFRSCGARREGSTMS